MKNLATLVFGLVIVVGSVLGSASAQAQTSAFLDIPGIPGESFDANFPDTVIVTSWSQSVANVGGPPVVMPLRFEHTIDRATPKLIEAALLNTNLGEVVLSVTRFGEAGAVAYLTITLSDTRVAAVEASNGENNVPAEQVTLTCTTYSLSYRRQTINGTLDDPIVVDGTC
ncbi:MAG: Hcp family type VI secretion system effector [Gammaproteobacteria bacterium]